MEAADTCSTNTNKVIETKRVSFVRHVARTRKTNKWRLLWGTLQKKDGLEDQGVEGEDNSKMGLKN
jgi:hypothetical protein